MHVRPVTACLITLDEERNVGPCLESLSFCDEAVVVDCGSTDRTVEIAEEHGARVLVRDWPGVVEQKNRAVEAASNDWVLCLDADERVTPDLRASIERVMDAGAEPCAAGYVLPWETIYLGGPVRSDRGRSRWKVRLFDRRRGRWTGSEPHARVEVDGAIERLKGTLLHHTYRDVAHHVDKMNVWTTAAARAMLGSRRSVLAGVLVRAPWAFVRTYVLCGGFRDGGRGFVVAGMSAYYVFLKYAKLAELRKAGSKAHPGVAHPSRSGSGRHR